MDAKACWLSFLSACDERDFSQAYEYISSLNQWFERGGFRINQEPGWPSAQAVKQIWFCFTSEACLRATE